MDVNERRTGRWGWLVALAVFLSFSFTLFFSAAASADMMPFSVKTTKDELNIRVKADTNSDILTVIQKAGTVLYPIAETDGWYEIQFANHLYGYVYKEYVIPGDAYPMSIKLFPGAAIRTSASTSGQIDTICSTNTKVSVSMQDDTWYYVTAMNGESGYILKSSVATPKPDYPVIEGEDKSVTLDTMVKVTYSSSVNIRSGPATSYSLVTTVASGTILTVLSQVTGGDGYAWYKITTANGKEGYIRGDLVSTFNAKNALAGKTIVIDPGHGCYKTDTATTVDGGNVGSSGLKESDVVLSASLYLRAYLEASGATVIVTRPVSDVGVLSLATRAEVADEANADMFISVHCNASSTYSSKSGAITYYFSGSTATPVSTTLLAQRKALSSDVQSALVAETGAQDLGTDSDSFTVLVSTTMPSVMVELGYITNSSEEAKMATTNYQILCAKGMYKGILNYFN